jgi:hypothetical protein
MISKQATFFLQIVLLTCVFMFTVDIPPARAVTVGVIPHSQPQTRLIAPLPSPYIFTPALAVISTKDMWYGDGTTDAQGITHSVMEHFDGTSWKQVSVPDDGAFEYLAAGSPNNIWASVYGPTSVNSSSNPVPALEHWDGKSWQLLTLNQLHLPPAQPTSPPPTITGFSYIAAKGNDVWLLASYDDPTLTNAYNELMYHYDGRHWEIIENGLLFESALSATGPQVAVLSLHNIWGIGVQLGFPIYSEAIFHYDGSHWINTLQNTNVERNYLAGSAPDDVWTGNNPQEHGPEGPPNIGGPEIISHWDGQAWQTMNLAPLYIQDGKAIPLYYSGIIDRNPYDVWVWGFQYSVDNVLFHEHWNGHTWSVELPNFDIQSLIFPLVDPDTVINIENVDEGYEPVGIYAISY